MKNGETGRYYKDVECPDCGTLVPCPQKTFIGINPDYSDVGIQSNETNQAVISTNAFIAGHANEAKGAVNATSCSAALFGKNTKNSLVSVGGQTDHATVSVSKTAAGIFTLVGTAAVVGAHLYKNRCDAAERDIVNIAAQRIQQRKTVLGQGNVQPTEDELEREIERINQERERQSCVLF
ncbi:MAG: hypothetical protein AB7F64_05385 [Gammaproteobacteria bacterium]